MAKRNGTARLDDHEKLPKVFSFRPDDLFNVRVREYMIENNISFNDLCDIAVREFLERHPRWPRRTLRRPTGKRPAL